VLCGWMVGPGARHVETLPEQEVLDGCMELIRRFLGSTYAVVDCIAMKRYFCTSDCHKYFVSSLSFVQVQVVFKSAFSGQLLI
jgi:hypothetical protein